MKLLSKSLIDYFSSDPEYYDVAYTHYGIDLVSDTSEELNNIVLDLRNIKNYVGKDLFRINGAWIRKK